MNIVKTNTSRVLFIAPEYSMTPEVIFARASHKKNSTRADERSKSRVKLV